MKILAAFDLDALIPLIIGIFWVVAQLAGAAKKKAPPASPLKENREPEEYPLSDLMRRLGGVQEFKIPKPPKPEPVVDVAPLPQPPVQVPEPEPVTVPDIDVRPTMSSFKTAMPSMKLPAMNLNFQTLEKSGSGFPKVGKIIDPTDKQTLRRAILGHIILGSPKGLPARNSGHMD